MNNYHYQVGGCLTTNASCYAIRQADRELYQALIRGQFCYVLNSRQMGKSSLRVQTMHRLQRKGMSCAAIDMTRIGSNNLTPQQWYKGVVFELLRCFNLLGKINFKAWWQEKEHLSNNQRLIEFIEEIILAEVNAAKIFIFIDEIDSVLGLNFPVDDFFALIRYCYNQRAENPDYNRLAFALFGVATPSDLIQDRDRTPFNIGQAIELQGFQFNEVQPLIEGLKAVVSNPQAVMKEILAWTSGQPFLTQKLCDLVKKSSQEAINQIVNVPPGTEAFWIEQLVHKQIINNWETQDEPEHLRTIRDRILNNEEKAGRLLGIYQQILQGERVTADESPAKIELLLSGLVVKQNGNLVVRNRIYEMVFDLNWVDRQLSGLRPYSETFNAWIDSNCQDESRLLRGKALIDAKTWSQGKSLSDWDYKFLAASQELEQKAEREATQILTEANRTLEQAQQQAKRTIKKGLVVLGTISTFATGLLLLSGFLSLQIETRRKSLVLEEISNLSISSELQFASEKKFEALLTALKASHQFKQASWAKNNTQIKQQVTAALQQAVYWISEKNTLFGHSDRIWSVAWSPDGQIMASPSEDGTVRLWRKDGQLLNILTAHHDKVSGASFSPDGKFLATSSEDGTAKLWTRDGQLIKTLTGHKSRLWGVAFSPDSKTLATASDDFTIKLWTLEGKEIRTLTGHTNEVRNVTFSPDGKTLATASEDNTVKIWTVEGKLLHTFIGHSDRVLNVKFSPDGKLLATSSGDKTIKLWHTNGKLIHTFQGHGDEVNAVAFSKDGQIIASAGEDGTVKLWTLEGMLIRTLTGHQGRVWGVSFSPDGKILATSSDDGTIKLWQWNFELTKILTGHQNLVHSVSVRPQGDVIATVSADKTIKLWNLAGEELETVNGNRFPVWGLTWSPNGQIFVTACDRGIIKLWDFKTKRNILTWKGHSHKVASISFSPNGQKFATASEDGTVKLWNLQGQELATLKGHDEKVTSVSWSPDGQIIAAGSENKTIKFWNVRGQELATLTGHNSSVLSVAWSPDGKTLASASADKTVKLWNRQGEELKTFQGHQGHVWSVAWSPDGKTLASASADKTVKLWNRQGEEIAALTGYNPAKLFSISFTPDGKKIVAASEDHTAIAWDLRAIDNLEDLEQKGCDWIQDYLENNPNLKESDRNLCDGI
ncbi:WD-repeat protein [Stanieria sp. NIES-3757]|nr:WD-repeat protein [Stanieria sp. NIES-3757]